MGQGNSSGEDNVTVREEDWTCAWRVTGDGESV